MPRPAAAPFLLWLLLAPAVLPSVPGTRAGEDPDPGAAAVASLRERIRALRDGELRRLEVHLAGGPAADDAGGPAAGDGPILLPAIRIERTSEIQTFLDHLEGAPFRRVLVLGAPAPALARVEVLPLAGQPLVVDLTARAFRVLGEAGAAFTFQAPALLRWLEDRIEAPDFDLREGREPSLPALLATLRRNTTGLAREAQEVDPGRGAGPPRGAGEPLVSNGGFEEEQVVDGRRTGSPLGWDRVDRLTTFWTEDPFPRPDGTKGHRVLAMDTDVLESEWLRRKAEMAADPDSPPWTKTLVPPEQQYSTVGGNYGVSCYSDPFPVEPGRAYRIALAMRACAADGGIAKVWVRGYGRLEVRGVEEWRRIYDSLHTLRTDDPSWHEYTQVFHPTKNTPHVERMRVMLYGYWPRGEYRWDDVRVVPISDEEYRAAKDTERSDVK